MNGMHCSWLLIDEKRVSVSLAFGIECSEGELCADGAKPEATVAVSTPSALWQKIRRSK